MAAHPTWLEGFTVSTEEPAPHVPILLLDAFSLQRVTETAIRCAVIGCVGGELRLIPESHIYRLPKRLIEAWHKVARRPLRSVRATDFVLCAMDAFNASATDWQTWLRAMVHVRVADEAVHLEPLQSHGAVTVSAAVARVALRQSALDAFDNPRAAGEVTHHWWLPTLEPDQLRKGRGLLLVYTLPDPAMFEGADNRAVQRRIAADLGALPTNADARAMALEAFLSGAVGSSADSNAAPLEPSVSPTSAELRAVPDPAGTLEPLGAYQPPSQSRGADWSSDFAVYAASKRATQSAWWRDFAPNAVGVDQLFKRRGLSADHASDFG